jgi:hypothetical protein
VSAENSSETRGRPFRPGESGNPGGRPRGLARRIREEIGADGSELIAIMVGIARSADTVTRDRMQAVAWLSDRAFGRNNFLDEEEEAEPPDYPMLDLAKLSDDELDLLIELHKKARPET